MRMSHAEGGRTAPRLTAARVCTVEVTAGSTAAPYLAAALLRLSQRRLTDARTSLTYERKEPGLKGPDASAVPRAGDARRLP